MKKILSCLSLIALLLTSACSVTQEMKEGVSFEGLKTFYIDSPAGTSQLFVERGDVSNVDADLVDAIAQNLKAKGFERVDEKNKAQIIFRPLWSVSMATNEDEGTLPLAMAANKTSTIGFADNTAYATLEIQAILPDGDLWAWRGFSPIQMSAKCYTSGLIKEQVYWCLEYFPPEQYPSKLEEIKEEKARVKAENEQNPFNDVLINERQRQEKENKIK